LQCSRTHRLATILSIHTDRNRDTETETGKKETDKQTDERRTQHSSTSATLVRSAKQNISIESSCFAYNVPHTLLMWLKFLKLIFRQYFLLSLFEGHWGFVLRFVTTLSCLVVLSSLVYVINGNQSFRPNVNSPTNSPQVGPENIEAAKPPVGVAH